MCLAMIVLKAVFDFRAAKSPESANILTLYVWLNDGKKLRYDFDVTKQARNAKDPMNVSLIVGGIELPAFRPCWWKVDLM